MGLIHPVFARAARLLSARVVHTGQMAHSVPATGVPGHPLTELLDPLLLQVLACPAPHHAGLTLGEPGHPMALSLTCTECGRIFDVRDGIPVLLLDDARWPLDPVSS